MDDKKLLDPRLLPLHQGVRTNRDNPMRTKSMRLGWKIKWAFGLKFSTQIEEGEYLRQLIRRISEVQRHHSKA